MCLRNLCGQRRPRPACASEPSDLGLHCPLTESLDTVDCIAKTYLYNFDPPKPHLYIYVVKLGFIVVYIISLISAQKHRLWVLVRTASSCEAVLTSTHNICFEQKYEKFQNFYLKTFSFFFFVFFFVVKFSINLNRRVFVMVSLYIKGH